MIVTTGVRGRAPIIAVLVGTVLALIAAMLALPAAPAAAANAGCTVATATRIDLGTANTIATKCAGERYYNYVDLKAGDILTIDFDARGAAQSSYLYLYNPGTTDFTIGTAYVVASTWIARGEMKQDQYRVYETGRFVIQWRNDARGMVFTPRVTPVTPSAGRVSGGCRIESAPVAPSRVTQYSDAASCSTDRRYWTVDIAAGSRVVIEDEPFQSAYIYLYEPGVTDFTVGQTEPWCGFWVSGRMTKDCGTALTSGNYIIQHRYGRAGFQPIVTIPVTVKAAKAGYGNVLAVDVNPDRGEASYAFRVQKRSSSGRWETRSTVYATDGAAETKRITLGAGVFRVWVPASGAYAAAYSRAVTLTAPTVKVAVGTDRARDKLTVNVDPDRGSGYWSFTVQKRSSTGRWATLPTSYRTEGSRETRTINLRKGTYRVVVAGKYNYRGATSGPVTLAK